MDIAHQKSPKEDNENKISYTISLKSPETGDSVPISQIESHINIKLEVIIQNGGKTYTWAPKDNQNIFILMRE